MSYSPILQHREYSLTDILYRSNTNRDWDLPITDSYSSEKARSQNVLKSAARCIIYVQKQQ